MTPKLTLVPHLCDAKLSEALCIVPLVFLDSTGSLLGTAAPSPAGVGTGHPSSETEGFSHQNATQNSLAPMAGMGDPPLSSGPQGGGAEDPEQGSHTGGPWNLYGMQSSSPCGILQDILLSCQHGKIGRLCKIKKKKVTCPFSSIRTKTTNSQKAREPWAQRAHPSWQCLAALFEGSCPFQLTVAPLFSLCPLCLLLHTFNLQLRLRVRNQDEVLKKEQGRDTCKGPHRATYTGEWVRSPGLGPLLPKPSSQLPLAVVPTDAPILPTEPPPCSR